jgi:hypothetical protein
MYFYDGEVDESGARTDAQAKRYVRERGVGYREAVRLVMREQSQTKRYSGANGPWAMPDDVNPPSGIAAAYNSVSNVAVTAGHDAAEAAQRINMSFSREVIVGAASFVIERRKSQILANASPGSTDANVRAAYARVQRELPATWAAYQSGRMSADACREMFMVKYAGQLAARKYDQNGNEYRVYELDLK